MIASVRGQAHCDWLSRRRAPIRVVTALVAALAFAIGAGSAAAASTAVLDVAPAVDVATAPQPPPVDPAQPPPVLPLDAASTPTPVPAPVAVDPALAPVATAPPATVDPTLPPTPPATPTPTTPAAPAVQAEPAPDQLSPGLLAQVNAAATDVAGPPKSSADTPPVINPTRTKTKTDEAAPAAPPPSGDQPPGVLVGARKELPRLAALVPSLVPVTPPRTDAGAAAPRRTATVTRAGPIWHQFLWRDIGAGDGPSDLGTRALLAIIGILPFAPVDGPDRTVPPASQLALLIPVLGFVAFLFATRPIADPRRRGPHRYRAVALKPG